jgi:hypothetical protein
LTARRRFPVQRDSWGLPPRSSFREAAERSYPKNSLDEAQSRAGRTDGD